MKWTLAHSCLLGETWGQGPASFGCCVHFSVWRRLIECIGSLTLTSPPQPSSVEWKQHILALRYYRARRTAQRVTGPYNLNSPPGPALWKETTNSYSCPLAYTHCLMNNNCTTEQKCYTTVSTLGAILNSITRKLHANVKWPSCLLAPSSVTPSRWSLFLRSQEGGSLMGDSDDSRWPRRWARPWGSKVPQLCLKD